MELFDYSVMPTSQYRHVINTNIKYLKLHLKNNAASLIKKLIKNHSKEEILNELEQYTNELKIDKAKLEPLQIAVIILYNCISGDLVSVCETYGINQGHLGDSDNNKIFQKVKFKTLKILKRYFKP